MYERETSDTIHVLYIDDDSDISDMGSTFLEHEDDRFDVQTATSPTDGLAILADHEIDCIVSDYSMPRMTGIEFLETVREEHPDLPFILYTGKGSEEIASDAISAGVTDYLQKEPTASRYTLLANRISNAVDQYRSQRTVEDTKQKLSQVTEKTNEVLFMFNSNWTELLFINSAYEEVWDQSIPDLEENPRSFLKNVHPDDQQLVDETLERILDGEPTEVEHRILTDEGDVRWIYSEAKPVFDGDGNFTRIVGFVRDITERKEREQELTEAVRQNERFKKLIDQTSDLIFVVNEMGMISYINSVVEELLGYTPAELEGTNGFDLIHPDDLARAQDEFGKVIEDSAYIGNVELRVKHNNGDSIDLEVRARNLLDDPDINGVIVIGREITERKERQRELQHKNEQLEEFASMLSHDLRNPLNVAEGNLRLAIEECDSEHLNDVRQALARIEALTEDILSLARAGETLGETEAVELSTLVEACWRNVETGSAALVTETEATIQADRSRLKQLLENLIRNAVEHGGTETTMTVGDLPDGFYLEDDGSGIPKDKRDDVLEPGYSTSNAGTGFGLSIVREIGEAHEWDIEITSGTDDGARFEFRDVQRV